MYSAWWRYRDLLNRFLDHGFSKKYILQNFINDLCDTTRSWVESGHGNLPLFQRPIDEAYYVLEDMADHDYWLKTNIFRNDQDCQHEELIASWSCFMTTETIEDCTN